MRDRKTWIQNKILKETSGYLCPNTLPTGSEEMQVFAGICCRIISETSNYVSATGIPGEGSLLSDIPGTQSIQRAQTSLGPEVPESIHHSQKIQDGFNIYNIITSSTRRLANLDRFGRCLFTCPNLQTPSKVPQIRSRGKTLSVQMSALRHQYSTQSFLQDPVGDHSIYPVVKTKGNTSAQVHGAITSFY